jgi:lipoprotein-anchoring transpeptidase ErfK/SrfK
LHQENIVSDYTSITRRDFLKWGSLLGAWALLPSPVRAYSDLRQSPPASLGRITLGYGQVVREEAEVKAKIVSYKAYDDIIPLYAQVEGEAPWPSNPIWYQTDDGYIHSGYVQPVENTPSGNPVTTIDPPGIWLQVCVPIADTHWRVASRAVYRKLYYGTIYRAIAAVQDATGEWWYRLQEGIAYSPGPYVPAWSMRHVNPESVSALSAGVADKRIEVNIKNQVLTCFEGDTPVFSTCTATGLPGTRTPPGEYTVILKRFTAYMIGGEGAGYYNLPGIPFPTYFTASGIAVHGAYWHNDYGRPKSHGCVNVPADAARFVFRWTEPNLPYDTASLSVKRGAGTKVIVI